MPTKLLFRDLDDTNIWISVFRAQDERQDSLTRLVVAKCKDSYSWGASDKNTIC